ncbi:expressed unknown protein [Seminavis robusta]|uniref:Uncharacterized protein n=1 Tax=Seminavis robusta TaxID=568900 RepID=A0A9N8EXP4_9STRA|nr:expressed unknown protein [Seminavis robusta]|eukprot:Sro2730_g335690.1 n/a (143) ;mRNA; r:218-736
MILARGTSGRKAPMTTGSEVVDQREDVLLVSSDGPKVHNQKMSSYSVLPGLLFAALFLVLLSFTCLSSTTVTKNQHPELFWFQLANAQPWKRQTCTQRISKESYSSLREHMEVLERKQPRPFSELAEELSLGADLLTRSRSL